MRKRLAGWVMMIALVMLVCVCYSRVMVEAEDAVGSATAISGTTTVEYVSDDAEPAEEDEPVVEILNAYGTYIDTHNHIDVYAMPNAAFLPSSRETIMTRRHAKRPHRPGPHVNRPHYTPTLPPPSSSTPSSASSSEVESFTEQRFPAAAASELIAAMDEYGVEKSLVVVVPSQHRTAQQDYDDAKEAVSCYPDRLFLMGGGSILGTMIDETDSFTVTEDVRAEFIAKAEALVADGITGFGEMLVLHVGLGPRHKYWFAPADHPLYLLLSDIAARHNMPIDIHMEACPYDMVMPDNLQQSYSGNPDVLPGSVPGLERLLAHNRNTKIVWQHIGWDNTGYQNLSLLRYMLNTYPNLYLSLRVEERDFQVVSYEPMPNRLVDEDGKLRPEYLQLISDYPDRFMIGSDEFFGAGGGNRFAEGALSFETTWPLIDQLPPELAYKVGYENAARVYRLLPEQPDEIAEDDGDAEGEAGDGNEDAELAGE